MRTRVYKLYSAAAGTSAVKVGKDGKITSIQFVASALGAAVTTGAEQCELMLNTTTSQIGVSDTPGTSLGGLSVSVGNASSGAANATTVGLAVDVRSGDSLVLAVANAYGCTSPSSFNFSCFIAVAEA